MIITDWDYRISDVLKLCKEFIDETGYDITYSQEHSLEYLWSVLQDPECDVLIIYQHDEPSAFAIVAKGREFHSEYFGYLMKFYISKTSRGSGMSRILMQDVVDWFDANECIVSFATATGNINSDQLFKNLLLKFGYVNNGFNLTRKLNVKI